MSSIANTIATIAGVLTGLLVFVGGFTVEAPVVHVSLIVTVVSFALGGMFDKIEKRRAASV